MATVRDTPYHFRMEVQEIVFFRRLLSSVRRGSALRGARCGDVVTLTMYASHQTLALVRCQDHHQGRRGRRWHRLGALLTVAAVASVSQDGER